MAIVVITGFTYFNKKKAMRKIDQLLIEYGESHQNHTNKLIHWICVPLIFLSIIGMIWSVPNGFLSSLGDSGTYELVNWATICLTLVLLYYLMLSVPLFIGMLLVIALFISAVYALDQIQAVPLWAISLIIFLIAWVGQFYGHKIEGKKPSFFKDLQFLLIGPAWLMHFIFKKLQIPY